MSNRDRPRLLSFTLDDWPVLGGPVSVELTDGVAVLVGWNGSGKSAIVEGFMAIAEIVTDRSDLSLEGREDFPKKLVVDILTPDHRQLRYEYHLLVMSTEVDSLEVDDIDIDEDIEELFSWDDSCTYLDQGKEIVWETDFGETKIYSNNKPSIAIAILGSFTLLSGIFMSTRKRTKKELPAEMEWLYQVLNDCQIINNRATRRHPMLRDRILQGMKLHRSFSQLDLVEATAYRIIRLDESDFEELIEVCSRIGIASQVSIKKFVMTKSDTNGNIEEEYIFEVLLDGTNIGLLSDGTLRVLSILVELIRPSPISTTIIEEPEQQIHPGLLSKLLKEMQVYTLDENLIISTHSSQVVSEMKPEQIHLVERVNGRTAVRKLNGSEIANVHAYLTEEGDLGEWVYSGILDGE